MAKLDYQIASTHQIHQDIAQRLNRYRIHLELTQQELADEAGISVPTLSRLLNGKGATLDTFLRVLKAMNLVEAMAAYIPEPRDSPLAPRRARQLQSANVFGARVRRLSGKASMIQHRYLMMIKYQQAASELRRCFGICQTGAHRTITAIRHLI